VGFIVAREMKHRDDYGRQADARVAGLAQEEHAHASALRVRSGGTLGSDLRAAVLGANDGLSSNFCLIMGVAGGGASSSELVLIGIAGLIGGASSMALGEWLSVTNARELALSQVDRSVDALQPDTARPSDLSAGNAANAAVSSFLLFALGALVPLFPMPASNVDTDRRQYRGLACGAFRTRSRDLAVQCALGCILGVPTDRNLAPLPPPSRTLLDSCSA
jgi:VIT family